MKKYLLRLKDYRNTQLAALRSEETVLELRQISKDEGAIADFSGVAIDDSIAACKKNIAKRKAHIADIENDIAAARANLAKIAA